MKVYKYISLRNFAFAAEILCKQKFHAASFFELNDPMEGLFEYPDDTQKEYVKAIVEGKKKLRICSFSTDPKNPLLWAHYADGFKGVCIEIDLKEHRREEYEIVPVDYSPERNRFSNDAWQLVDRLAREFLSKKSSAWEYEREVRILSKDEYVQDGIIIRSVLLGIRTPDVLRDAIVRIAPGNISVYETHISGSNDVEKGEILKLAHPQSEQLELPLS